MERSAKRTGSEPRREKRTLTYLLGFAAGLAAGLLVFASRPEAFIPLFSRWG